MNSAKGIETKGLPIDDVVTNASVKSCSLCRTEDGTAIEGSSLVSTEGDTVNGGCIFFFVPHYCVV